MHGFGFGARFISVAVTLHLFGKFTDMKNLQADKCVIFIPKFALPGQYFAVIQRDIDIPAIRDAEKFIIM